MSKNKKLNRKIFKDILEDFKFSLNIATSIDNFEVAPFYFYEFLNNPDNLDLREEYFKIEEYNSFYLEERVAKDAYDNVEPSAAILLELIKYRNKSRYKPDIDTNKKDILSNLSDEELDKKIKEKINKHYK